MKKAVQSPKTYQYLWLKIRLWQRLNGISDELLASFMEISPRTFRDYDKSAFNLSLGRLENFLKASGLTIQQLLEI